MQAFLLFSWNLDEFDFFHTSVLSNSYFNFDVIQWYCLWLFSYNAWQCRLWSELVKIPAQTIPFGEPGLTRSNTWTKWLLYRNWKE